MELWTTFVLGLMGSLHCAGMCGAIVSAFAGAAGSQRPVNVLAYNAGRIASYSFAGAIVGIIGSTARYADAFLPAQQLLYALAAGMLVVMGLALAGAARELRRRQRGSARDIGRRLPQRLAVRLTQSETRVERRAPRDSRLPRRPTRGEIRIQQQRAVSGRLDPVGHHGDRFVA